MKNYSVLKHSLRTGSLSILECFNTHIRKSVSGISGVMAAPRSPKPSVKVRVLGGTPNNLHDSSIGKDAALSRRKDEFDSRIVYQFTAWLVKWYNQTLPTFSQEFDSLTPHQMPARLGSQRGLIYLLAPD